MSELRDRAPLTAAVRGLLLTFPFPAGADSKVDRFGFAIPEIHMLQFIFDDALNHCAIRVIRDSHTIVAHRVKFVCDSRVRVSPVRTSVSGLRLCLIVQEAALQQILVEVTEHVLATQQSPERGA